MTCGAGQLGRSRTGPAAPVIDRHIHGLEDSQTAPGQTQPPLSHAIQMRREHVRARVAAERERLAQLERQILGTLERAAQGLVHERELLDTRNGEVDRAAADADARCASLATRAAELDRLAEELDKRAGELAARQRAQAQREEDFQDQLAAREAEIGQRARTAEARLAECGRREVELQERATAMDAERKRSAKPGQNPSSTTPRGSKNSPFKSAMPRRDWPSVPSAKKHSSNVPRRSISRNRRPPEPRDATGPRAARAKIGCQARDIEFRVAQCAEREAALQNRSMAVAAEQEAAARRLTQAEHECAASRRN